MYVHTYYVPTQKIPKNELYKQINRFVFYVLLANDLQVGWLIPLLTGVGWDIIGYESETLTYYNELKNCLYSIKLSYTKSLSNPKVHLSRPGITIAPTISYPASNPPLWTAHRWGGRPPFPICSPVASWCTPRWGVSPRIPLPPLQRGGGTPTLGLPCFLPLSPWSVAPPGGGTPSVPWASTPSQPSSCEHWLHHCLIHQYLAPNHCSYYFQLVNLDVVSTEWVDLGEKLKSV